MNGLVLHTGGHHVTREEVAAVATPENTRTWYPIPHMQLIERVESALETLNLRVTEQAHALAKDGLRYFGLMRVANGHEAGDYSYVMGLRNAHDRSFTASLAVGSQVFICDNLAFSGEIQIARKHTLHIQRDLPLLAVNAVGQLTSKWGDMDKRIGLYKQRYLTDARAHDLIIRGVDANAATITQVPAILQHWREPLHAEFQDKTAWRLFNAFTEVDKGTSLAVLPQRTIALHALMDAEVGFEARN